MNNEIEKLEEKIQCLEESIIEFENSHIKQVNNLINLFSDVIDIIKDKKEENEKKVLIGTTSDIKEDESNDIDLNLPEIEINENNEFKNKSTKEIVDYIYNLQKENLKDVNENKSEEINPNNDNLDSEHTEDILKSLSELKIEDILGSVKKENVIDLKETYNIEKNIAPVLQWINAFKDTDRWKAMKNKLKSFSNEDVEFKEMEMM